MRPGVHSDAYPPGERGRGPHSELGRERKGVGVGRG